MWNIEDNDNLMDVLYNQYQSTLVTPKPPLERWKMSLALFTSLLTKVYQLFPDSFNPNWHELWKTEKCLSLAPPRGIFHKTRWACQGVKLTYKKNIECFGKNSTDKVWSEKDKVVESALPHAN